MKIAFLGMGRMGLPMARRLAQAGHQMTVWNRTHSKCQPLVDLGAELATTPRNAARDQDVVITMLTDAPQVGEVLLDSSNGAIHEAKWSTLFIDMSTMAPRGAKELGELLVLRNGICFLDAPVTGGVFGAEQGKLTILVGGYHAQFERAQPVFEALGTAVYCGPWGAGQEFKAINQAMCAINQVSVSVGLLLAEKLGRDPKLVVETLKRGAAGSWALENLGTRAVQGDMDSGFKVVHMRKDLLIVGELAARLGIKLPGVDLAEQLLQDCMVHGEGDQATQSMLLAMRRMVHKQ